MAGACPKCCWWWFEREGRHIQTVLDMDVELPNGDFLPLKILVDTGAQVNLVRRDLVPRQDWRPAPNPVRLITANSSILRGGDKVVELGLNFNVCEDGFVQPQPISFKGDFYGAEVEFDAILSYPWLRENSVGVFPHRDALARDWPYFGLLYAWKEKVSPKVSMPWKNGADGGGAACFGRTP